MKPHAATGGIAPLERFAVLRMVTAARQSAWPMEWPIDNLRSTWAVGQPVCIALTLLPLTNVESTSAMDADEDVVQLVLEWDLAPRWTRSCRRRGGGSAPHASAPD